MHIKICAYSARSRHTVTMCRYINKIFYIHQDLCSLDIKESKTAGSIIMFSNGDKNWQQTWWIRCCQTRKPYSFWFTVFTEPWHKKCLVKDHQSVEVTPAILKKSCWEIFKFFMLMHNSLSCAIHKWINYYGALVVVVWKKGRVRSSCWKGKSAKESLHSISLLILCRPSSGDFPLQKLDLNLPFIKDDILFLPFYYLSW